MRKFLIVVAAVIGMIVIAGCSGDSEETSTENTTNETETQEVNTEAEANEDQNEVEDLNFQVLKSDEEAGVTVENNPFYGSMADFIASNPKIGIPNDFSLFPFDIAMFEGADNSFIFFAINRLPDPIKNISFDLTFGNQNGEYIWDGAEIILSEDETGVIKPNGVVPILLDITPEEEAVYDTLTEDNVDMQIDNFDMEVVE